MKQRAYMIYAAYVFIGFVLLALGCVVGNQMGLFAHPLILSISSLVIMLLFVFSSGLFKQVMYIIFCLLEGVLLIPLLTHYADLDGTVVSLALVALATLVTAFLIVGLLMKDLSRLGCFLFYGLIGLLVISLLRFILPIPSFPLYGAALFSLYIAYDINYFKLRIQQTGGVLSLDEISQQAMNQFLNILNLFVKLLKLIASSRD